MLDGSRHDLPWNPFSPIAIRQKLVDHIQVELSGVRADHELATSGLDDHVGVGSRPQVHILNCRSACILALSMWPTESGPNPKGTTSRGCGKTRSAQVSVEERPLQGRVKHTESMRASAPVVVFGVFTDFFRCLFPSCRPSKRRPQKRGQLPPIHIFVRCLTGGVMPAG
jgi:hypothetical protein